MLLELERKPLPGVEDVHIYEMTYESQGLPVKACYAVPAGEGAYPPIVYCRGGIGQFGMVRPVRMAELARRGYAVAAPYYRGSISGAGRDEFGGDDRHDVYAVIQLLRSLPKAAPLPVGVIGFSRGAVMALLAARDCPEVAAAVVYGGVSDMLLSYEERVDLRRMMRRVIGHPVKQREAYLDRSPVAWAGDIRVPVLIVHGTDDENVNVEHARRLADALEREGKTYRLELFEGMKHVFTPEADRKALHILFEWINRRQT